MKTNIVKKITSYFTLSIFTFVMSVGQVHAAAAPASVGLAISPISQTVAAGQTVSYSIMASNDQPTYAMQFSVNYDANLLTLNNVVSGSGTSSWSMEKNTNQAGVIKLGFYNTNPLGLTDNPQQVAFITFTVKSAIPNSYNPKIEIVPTVNADQTIPVMFGIDGFNEADLAAGQITNATVTVSVPNVAPSVSLTGPLTAVTLPSSVNITGTASDSDGTVSKVEIFNGATKLGDATLSGSSYSFTWAAAAGTHSITAKATDNSGAVTTSSALSVTVNPKPNVAPSVSLTGPLTAVTLPSSVNITGTASDSDGTVSKVEIFNGATKLGDATLSGSSYSFTWAAAAGTHSITAKATDNSGAVTTSSALSVTVNSKPNVIPVATAQSVTTAEDSAKVITLAGTDADGDSLTYVILTQPTHGALSGTAPNLTYTPAANYNGSDSFTFKVNDGKSDSAGANVTLTVTAVNDAPTVSGQSLSTPQDTAKAITLAASDIDGNTLTYNIVASPAHGSLSGTAPNLTYTPADGYRGSDSFTFKVNDGTVDSAIATINMNMTAVNHAPSATAQSLTTAEDTAKAITLAGTDSDNDALTYIIVNQPAHGALSGTAPNLTYTPAANYNGSDSFAFKVNDGNVDSATATVSMSITAVNDAPTATAQVAATSEDTAKAITLAGSDMDGDSLTYSIVSGPVHGSLSGTAPNLTYTPVANYSGSDSFTFKVNDGKVDSAAATVSLNISDVNHAPSATAQSLTTAEDTAKAITLAGTDSDNDALTYIIVNQPAHGALSGTAPNLTYTPTANYNGSDSFTFKVSDGFIQSATATVSVSITAVNDAPTATAQSTSTTEDTAKAVTLAGSDTDGDSLTYAVLTQPAHGVLSGTVPNLTYTPEANYNGSDSFTFKVNDGKVDSAAATINMSIVGANDVPVATAQAVTATEDAAKAITLAGTDSDNDALTYIIVNQPAHGALSGTAPNLTYTPAANYNGGDSFTFKINDGKADSSVAAVTISIAAVNDAPSVAAQSITTLEDTAKAVTLSGSDIDGDALSYIIVNQPANGSLSGTAPNLIYTPAAGFYGNDSFTYKATDTKADSNTATVSVTISHVNHAPSAASQNIITAEDTAKAIVLSGSDSDKDDLTYTFSQPAHGVLSGTAPNLTYTPSANYHGNDSFTFKVNDGKLDSAAATVSLKVTPVNDNPKAAFKMDKDSGIVPLSIGFSAEDSMDPDSTELEKDIVSYSWNFGDGSSEAGVRVSHSYSNEGSYTATLTITDKEGVKDVISKVITVNPKPNELPIPVAKSDVVAGTVPVTVNFRGQDSRDPDGSIVSYRWDFGDGTSSTDINPTKVYNTTGTYTVRLTVTDNKGARETATMSISANGVLKKFIF